MSNNDNLKMLAVGSLFGIVVMANFIYLKDGISPFNAKNDMRSQIKSNSLPLTQKEVKKIYAENNSEILVSKTDTVFYLVPSSQLKIQ